ncbi:restriction endonuclease [Paenibacillus apiarius]|uniref:Restriction endonuclease n=1 Tax=Paenibacillus apiarius TaxID=46240 RepID=A0ABT4DUK7_9BACL|nr:restriction endonuclease [Paenibacillus apiarius]MCY9521014.1 restriction endonuclease [Paenibacillus apiarius]MCY9551860.1 restriction endonuclease [Paenibacillus apiarius]MCY9557748.1 restriction endonuclease [Paenibacillus apiarius]MCY9684435.1 restriction endonuclease [Paenibacillus apiarius]
MTKAAGDYGADLVIQKEGKKIVVQAKRYNKNVGIKAVQEAQASIAHYGAGEAWVVSNSAYTAAAYDLAKSNKVRTMKWGNWKRVRKNVFGSNFRSSVKWS